MPTKNETKPTPPVVILPSKPNSTKTPTTSTVPAKTPTTPPTVVVRRDLPPPKMSFSGINPLGCFTLKFDQKMKFSSDPAAYRNMFKAKVKSAATGKSSSNSNSPRKLRGLQAEEETTNGFQLEFLSSSDYDLTFQLVFDDPSRVSSTRDGSDTFSLEILDLSMFQSAESDKPLNASMFDSSML